MGLGEKWIKWTKWTKWCISTMSFSILVNGSPLRFFQSSRSLKQKDPLSPYLFVIVMEALSCLLKRAKIGSFLSGWWVRGRGGEKVEVSHMLFVDDTLAFCELSEDQLTYLCWLFMRFEVISKLKVNWEKSKLIPMGSVENIEELAQEFGCKVGALPSSYLGLPLDAHFKTVSIWDNVKERFRKRLALWKRQCISKGKRLTSIRSTLSSMSIYFMSLFCISRTIKLRLE